MDGDKVFSKFVDLSTLTNDKIEVKLSVESKWLCLYLLLPE
jgi:hypothetical protein